MAHGRADDGERRGQAVDGRAEGADGRVQLTWAGAHGRRAKQGLVERMVTDASVTRGGAQRRRRELTGGVCKMARGKEISGIFCIVNNAIVSLFRYFTQLLNR